MKRECAAYMEKARWPETPGFVCPHCHAARAIPSASPLVPSVLRCRKCRHDTGLTVGTVMERSHMAVEHMVLGGLFGRQP